MQIRLKTDIPLKRISEILPDGSYEAELSGDGVTGGTASHRFPALIHDSAPYLPLEPVLAPVPYVAKTTLHAPVDTVLIHAGSGH
jgi:hypothetical protein